MIEGISKIIHLSPPLSSQWTGRLSKLSPIAEILFKIAKEIMNYAREISIDESMIKYKGRHISKQYVKKVIKMKIQGIYIVRFKNKLFMKFTLENQQNRKYYRNGCALRLIEELRSNWHHLYCDNWYSSPELFRILANKGFRATGTVRKKERITKVSYK